MKIKNIFQLLLLAVIVMGVFGTPTRAAEYGLLKTTLLNQDPDPAEPGKAVELRWKIEKLGSEKIKDVTFEVLPSYPFTVDSGVETTQNAGSFFGSSSEDEFYIAYYKMRVADDALEGTYDINLRYNIDGGDWVTNTYSVRVGEKQNPTFVIGKLLTSPRKLVADTKEAELSVDIENIGDGDAENVQVEMLLPEGFSPSFAYSEIDNLGKIVSGTSNTATFYLDTDKQLEGKAYEAILRIKYKEANDDTNVYKSVEIPLQIPIKDKPYFEIESITTTPSVIRPGNTVSIKLNLNNVGGEDANTVSIRAFKESTQPFTFDEKSDYIGSITSGESGEAVLQLTVDKDAVAKEYKIELETRAIDGDEVIIQDESFSITIDPAKRGIFVFLQSPIAIIMLLGVVGFIVYNVVQKKK